MADNEIFIDSSDSDTLLPEKKIFEPIAYINQKQGKSNLELYLSTFNHWLKLPTDVFRSIVDLSDTFFNATVLIDDVLDNSALRRGLPTAHVVYGPANVIACGIYASFLSVQKVQELAHPEIANMFVAHILKMYRSQAQEIHWRDNSICPTEKEYMALVKQMKTNMTKLNELFALYAQIRNDYCNLCDKKYAESKTYCDDITEGKFSFPIIHVIKSKPDDNAIKRILRMRTKDNALKKYCVSLIEECGSFKYTLKVLESLEKQIRAEIAKLGGNPLCEILLNALVNLQSEF